MSEHLYPGGGRGVRAGWRGELPVHLLQGPDVLGRDTVAFFGHSTGEAEASDEEAQ